MENNWKEVAEKLLNKELGEGNEFNAGITGEVVEAMVTAMDLVFEATKKECADKAEVVNPKINWTKIDKESILNITKPNI